MTKRFAHSFTIAVAVAAGLLVSLPAPVQGQAKGKGGVPKGPSPAVVHKPIPRTPDGKPDLSGTWQSSGVSINGEEGAPPLHPLPPIDDHPVNRQPLIYKPEYDAARKAKNYTAVDDPTLYCLLPGVPRTIGMPMPMEFVQTPKVLAILHEAFRAWRRIPIGNDLKHADDLTPTWMGDSVGRWEGDTLVVDTIGFNDKTWISGVGTTHTEQMHVVERYTLHDDGSMSWEATVTDPGALASPYVTGGVLRTPIGVHVEEYECAENNPDPGHMKKAMELESKALESKAKGK